MKYIFAIILSLSSSCLLAGPYCTEKVTSVILHKNGAVNFKTDKSCSDHWCQVKWDDSEQINRAFSSLLAAKAAGRSTVFNWPDLSSCSEKNVVYASPSTISF